jgi:DNA-directed RNA polymerase subunit RPC12/RpoP
MATRKFTCLNDNAQFTEQEAARLCVRCQEPYRPQADQINRCSSCGAESESGKLSCECANGRLEDSGYRCPSCGHEGGAEMLDAPLACPYCLNAVERPEDSAPKSTHQLRRVGVRRVGQIAALFLCVVGTLAAAYELAPQVIERWNDLSKIFPAKRAATKNVQPGVETPQPIKVSQPLEPSQPKPDPRVPDIQGQPAWTAQSQPVEQQSPAAPPAQIPQPGNPSGGASNQPPPVEKPAVRVAPPVIVSFTSSAQSIDRGATATLRWEVTGDSPTVTILPGVGTVPSTGFWQVKPEATQRFTLSATNSGESIPLTRSIEIVVVQPKRPTIVSFTADSSQLRLGQTTALRWTVVGASEVRIDPGIGLVGTTGTAVVRPLSGTAYTLTATGPGGTSTGALPISVDVPASAPPSAPVRYAMNPPPANPTGSNRTPFSGNRPVPGDRIDPQALELLRAVQSAMGGKRNLESIHDWQRTERVNWEVNGGWSMETTTFAAPSGIRVESQGGSTAVIFSNGETGWAWSSTQPVQSDLPSPTATSMPFRSLPALLLGDDDPQRTVALAGPSTLLIADNHGDRVFLKVDPSTHLPQAISWTNSDGAELEETYSNWRQSAGVLWWCHMTRSRNRQEFLRADVTNFHVNQGWTPQRIAFVGP